MEVCPRSYFWWYAYFQGPWMSFAVTDEFSVRVTKITSRIGVLWTHSLPFCFWPIFNSMNYSNIIKRCKPDNFEAHDSLKPSFTNICWLCLNFVECESFLESNSPNILALHETNLGDSVDSGNFSVMGYFPLIWKDSITHMHGLAVYVKEQLPFAQDLSLENFTDSYLCFWLALLHSVPCFLFLYWLPSSSSYAILDSILSTIDKVL